MSRSDSQDAVSPAKTPLTDSPWFWSLVFSAMGLVFLLVISPKYAQRQRRLEMQYYARQEIARRQVEGTGAAREAGEEGEDAPPALGELIIPLWPLGLVLAGTLAGSAAMLYRTAGRAAFDKDGEQP